MVKIDYAFTESSAEAVIAEGGPITVPDAHLLFTAQFSREGHDLLLTGEDGKTLLIVDYFGAHQPADLVSPEGAILSSSVVQSLAGPLAPGQYAQAGDQQPAAAIGKVTTLEGSASAQRTDGSVVELALGDQVALGDVLQTGNGSSVGVVFIDGTVFSLAGDSRMVLDNLVYQSGGSDNALNFSIVQGAFSFVAGQVAPTGEMNIETPVATMGIRGTAPAGICSASGPCNFILIPNPDDNHVGQYTLTGRDGQVIATVDTIELQFTVNSDGTYRTEPIDPAFNSLIELLRRTFERRAESDGDDGQDGGTRIVTIGSGIDTGIDPLDPTSVEAKLVDLLAALAEEVTEEIEEAAADDITDTSTPIMDPGSGPIIGNQPASFGGDADGDAVEDVGTSTEGTVTVDDPDGGESGVQPQTGTEGEFGTFTIDAAGNWTYVLNNGDLDVQALPANATATDSFDVISTDGSATITIVITITGTNDVPTITGEVVDDVVEDSAGTATGVLTVTDPDTGESAVAPQSNTVGSYGTFSIAANGAWTYVLNNELAATQGLVAGQVETETFTVLTADGTSQVVTITITGSNDAAVITGDTAGSVTEEPIGEGGGSGTATGDLNASDVDSAETFQAQTDAPGTYGSFSVAADGQWTYVLNNELAATQGLVAGQVETETFTVLTADGTSQVVTITITGSNDAAVITGDTAGSVTEEPIGEGGGSGTATGDLNASDVDSAETFQAQTDAPGTYGSFSVAADGQWTYVLNNELAATQGLVAGQVETETFTVLTADGTSQVVTITITGSNDGPTVSPVELPGTTEDAGSITISLADLVPDVSGLSLTNVTIEAGEGTVEYNGEGGWIYTPPENYSGDVTFNYTVSDGSLEASSTASLHIEAVADAPTLNLGNYGFELGDASGWSTNGQVSVITGSDGYVPQEGDYLTVLNTNGADQASMEQFLGLPPGALDAHASQDSEAPGYNPSISGNATSGSAAVIQLEVSAGDTISFDWNFVTSDYMPYNDYAIVTINGQIYTELSDVLALGNLSGNTSSTGWQTFTYTATESGTLTIGATVVDIGDQIVDSRLLIDNLRVGVSGDAGESIALNISSGLVDTDGSESLSILVQGLPDGATLSAGAYDAQLGGWVLTQPQLSGLSITSPIAGNFTLTVTATSTESSNGNSASSTGTIDLTVYSVEGNEGPSALDDSLTLAVELPVSPNASPAIIYSSELLVNDSDPNLDSLSIISVSGTSQQGATVTLNGDGNIEYTPPASFNALHSQGQDPILDQFTYTISDGKGGFSTATVYLEVGSGAQISSLSLFSASEAAPSIETALVPAGSSNKSSGWEPGRRDGEGRNSSDIATMHALAVAAGIAAFTPHWAQASEHEEGNGHGLDLAHRSEHHGWQGASIASLGAERPAGGNPIHDGRNDSQAPTAVRPAFDKQGDGLSGIIEQHFNALSDATKGWGHSSNGDGAEKPKVANADNGDRNRDVAGDQSPRAQHAETKGPDASHQDGWQGAGSAADGPPTNLDKIVDFTSLPVFDHAPDNGMKGHSFAALKQGDFAGIVEFGRDLVTEAHLPAAPPDRGGWKGGAAVANDVVQNMASDMESVAHHNHH